VVYTVLTQKGVKSKIIFSLCVFSEPFDETHGPILAENDCIGEEIFGSGIAGVLVALQNMWLGFVQFCFFFA
jgi:hypothetical protein